MSKVLLLCEYGTLNGGEQSMLAVLERCRAAGFSFQAVAPPRGPLGDALRSLGIEVVPLEHQGWGPRPNQAEIRNQLAVLLRRLRPNLLHANSLSMGRLSGPVARDCGVPSIAHLRDILRLSRAAIADLNAHQRLLAVSQATRDFHLLQGLSAAKTHVLYNGLDLDQFHPRARSGFLHRELQLPPDAPLVGVIGQIGLRKGQDVLLRAGAALSSQFPGLHYLLVGQRCSEKAESRRFEADLQAVAQSSLPGHVHFLGTREDVPEILNELTILVHPARQEPLGRVLLEAAASGLPVIATRVGGTVEIFPDGLGAARLIPPGDAQALAAEIALLLTEEPLRHQLGACARRRAESFFDVRRAAEGLIAHYSAIT